MAAIDYIEIEREAEGGGGSGQIVFVRNFHRSQKIIATVKQVPLMPISYGRGAETTWVPDEDHAEFEEHLVYTGKRIQIGYVLSDALASSRPAPRCDWSVVKAAFVSQPSVGEPVSRPPEPIDDD
jgi:hypothetical protein